MLGAGVGGTAFGCYPGEIENLADTELVVTVFDPGVFGEDGDRSAGFATYARPEVVVQLDSELQLRGAPVEPESGPLDATIWEAVDENLTGVTGGAAGLGYRRLTGDETSSADVYVLAGVVESDWVAWSCYPGFGYWGWWAGFADPIGPETAWCYPSGLAPVEFSTGTLILDVVRRDPASDDLEVVWSAAINGLLARTTDGLENQIRRAIDRAFAQSNYLRNRGAER